MMPPITPQSQTGKDKDPARSSARLQKGRVRSPPTTQLILQLDDSLAFTKRPSTRRHRGRGTAREENAGGAGRRGFGFGDLSAEEGKEGR
jgi:hypothetical protein